ncbi:MAG: hypothetical protein KDK24_11720 [Pseudooceanicola sp.]|nr:hypothetical protein [Pseudooceanicola sp.]
MDNDTQTTEKPNRKARAGKRAGAGAGKGAKAGKAVKAKAAEGKAEPATMAEKRIAKRKRLAEANTVTVILDTAVRKFIATEAKAAGMDIAPFMQKLVENYVLQAAPAGEALAKRLTAKRVVLDRIVEISREIDAAGGFDEHFILSVMKRAAADATFQANYETAVDADTADERKLERAKAPINQQMGRLIKRAANAKSKRDAGGKIQRAQVTGEVISTYTLLERA